jgi:uncharacterized protein
MNGAAAPENQRMENQRTGGQQTEGQRTEDQRAVVEFLSRPESYGLVAGPVERVETHCSIVFLADGFAYKLKRAIRYADLDYTTRAARRAACAAELVLNRRTAPDLYLGVRAIARLPDGRLGFDGAGPALEHVVVMRRFAQSCLFDSLAARRALTPELMASLGEALARFHRTAEVTPGHGGAAALRRVIGANARELARHAPPLDPAMIEEAGCRALAALARLAPLIERRRAEGPGGGKVRRCHGDLRLANIVLDGGRPLLFDGIEFSDEIACIDILYDLAFLLMDLWLRERSDLANLVFNAYLDRLAAEGLAETEGLAALPLFLSLRAATRSYGLAGSAGRKADPRERARLSEAARRHLAAAVAFLDPASPQLLAVAAEMPAAGGPAPARLAAATPLAATPLAATLAPLIPPPPGARILHPAAASAPPWREAHALRAAGCSVLVEGADLSADLSAARRTLATADGIGNRRGPG